IARRQLVSPQPGMVFISLPVAPSQVPPDRPPVYAPVALSGLTIAFDIESQSSFSAPADVKMRDGQRLTELKLTPRLVAKLLTQPTGRPTPGAAAPRLPHNPVDLTRDPDFLAVNPDFTPLLFPGIPDILLPLGLSDAAVLVWRWLAADPEARAFLAGTPD